MSLRIGIDVGGTFTDGLAVDLASGRIRAAKVPSTPDPADGFFAALDALLAAGGQPAYIAHGTTVATNALIQRRTARVALVSSAGFADVLEIGFQSRPELYDARVHRAPALVPRELCFEVAGRLGPDGREEQALDAEALHQLGERLARLSPPPDAVAICLLHSYRNDAHERGVLQALADRLGPDVALVASSGVCREFREYPRASTTVINAAVAPLVDRYLGRVEAGLAARGIAAGLYVMQSSGGIAAAAQARRRPAFMVESGPAAAVIAAADIAGRLGLPRALALDIGGTTAKVALVLDGRAAIAPELEVGSTASVPSRLGRGGGYPLRTPCVDLVEIGSGGGSIAWLDAAGVLRVGPQSAGAVPGPACYPGGGAAPTLTDANLVLGRLDAERFLGGELRLRADAAEAALAELGRAMGQSAVQAAAGVLAVAVDAMAGALRLAAVDKGHDPREFALIALGGAGPLHACEIARAAGVRSVVIPPRPGLGAARGLVTTDVRLQAVLSWPGPLADASLAEAAARVQPLAAGLARELAAQGLGEAEIEIEMAADLRYVGQSFELQVPWTPGEGAGELADRFHALHEQVYGFGVREEPVELVGARCAALGRLPRPPAARLAAAGGPAPIAGEGAIVTEGALRAVQAPIYERAALAAGHELAGPCRVHEPDATTYLPPGWRARVDEGGNLIATAETTARSSG